MNYVSTTTTMSKAQKRAAGLARAEANRAQLKAMGEANRIARAERHAANIVSMRELGINARAAREAKKAENIAAHNARNSTMKAAALAAKAA